MSQPRSNVTVYEVVDPASGNHSYFDNPRSAGMAARDAGTDHFFCIESIYTTSPAALVSAILNDRGWMISRYEIWLAREFMERYNL